MSFKQFNEQKQNVIKFLNRVNCNITDKEINQFICNKIENIEANKFTISIFGNFSNGKSTMLNALMGFDNDVLVVDELASTATITRLKEPEYEEMANKAEVLYSNGEKKLIDLDELKTFSARNEKQEVEEVIKEVTLFLDSEYLKNGVEIVDTPGFNSSHKIHTEIAKGYVDKSDASIFLFTFDKPGSDTEFKFLQYVNQYMNRIFFVVNKIDTRNKSENSLDEGISKLRNKLLEKNVEIGNKKIYPISAKLHQEGLRENSSKKLEDSKFHIFKEELAQYLTGNENTKDRLIEPLEAIVSKMGAESIFLQERITSCSKDQDGIMDEIKMKQKEIEEKKKILKEKKKHIQITVNESIRNAKSNFQKATEAILEEVKGEVSDVKTEFDAKLTDFGSLALGVYDKFLKKWNYSRELLENDLRRLIEENIDDLKTSQKLESKLMNIIHCSLDIEKIEIEDPKYDFTELQNIDKEIENSKKEYERNKEKLRMSMKNKKKYDELDQKRKELEEKINKLEYRKNLRLDQLGEPIPVKAARMKEERRDREGFFGKSIDKLFGRKVVQVKEEYIDYESVNFIEEQRKRVENEYSLQTEEQKIKIKENQDILSGVDDLEFDIYNAEYDEKQAREMYINMLKSSDDKKNQLEKTIIRISKKNYIKEIEGICNEYFEKANKFLDKQKSGITTILNESIKYDLQEIENLQNNLFNITTLTNKTPEEINIELKSLTTSLEELQLAIQDINKFKQGELLNELTGFEEI